MIKISVDKITVDIPIPWPVLAIILMGIITPIFVRLLSVLQY